MGKPTFDPDKLKIVEELGMICSTKTKRFIGVIEQYDGGPLRFSITLEWKYSTEDESSWKFSRKLVFTSSDVVDLRNWLCLNKHRIEARLT